jgi:hypothetical protein
MTRRTTRALAALAFATACGPKSDSTDPDTDGSDTEVVDTEVVDTEVVDTDAVDTDIDTDVVDTDIDTDAVDLCAWPPDATRTVELTSVPGDWTVVTNGSTSHYRDAPGGSVTGLAPGDVLAIRLVLPEPLHVDRELAFLGWFFETSASNFASQGAAQAQVGTDATFPITPGGNLSLIFGDSGMADAALYGTVAMNSDDVPAGSTVSCIVTKLTIPTTVGAETVAGAVSVAWGTVRIETWETVDDTGNPTSWP